MRGWSSVPTARQQIGALLVTLLTGVLSACLVTGFLLYYYGISGQYRAGDLLLEPGLVEKLSFIDTQQGRGNEGRMVLDGISLTYYDGHHMEESPLDAAEYAVIYRFVEDDLSLLAVGDDIKALFNGGVPVVMKLKVRRLTPKASGEASTRVFEELMAVGDFYRISLQAPKEGEGYAYFQQQGLADKMLRLVPEGKVAP